MKKLIWILVAIALAAGGYFAYKKYLSNDDLVNSIPKDAAIVFAVDLKSLTDKAGGEKLKEMNIYKRLQLELSKENDMGAKVVRDLLNDPLSSGVNFLKRMYIFTSVKNGKPVFGLISGLLSRSNFESTLKKFPMKDPITSVNGINILKIESFACLGWNDKQVVLIGGIRDSVEDYIKNIFDGKSSIASLSPFKKFNDSKFDAGAFINYGPLMSMTSQMSPGSALFADLYKDTYLDFVTSFENNSVVTNAHYYVENKDAKDRLEILKDKGLSDDHLKMITNKNLYGILSISLDMRKFIGMFETNPLVAAGLNEMGQQAGLSVDEMKDLLSGDISIAFTDVRRDLVVSKKYNYNEKTGVVSSEEVPDTTMMPMFTATLGIKNRAAFDKVIKRTGLQKQGPYYVLDIPIVKIYMVENKVGITVTNDKALADEMAQKKELVEIPEPAKTLVSKNGSGFYMDLDLKNYPEILVSKVRTTIGEKDFARVQNFLSIFKDFEGKGNRGSSTFELKLTDGSGNSLYRILDGIDKNIYTLIDEKDQQRKSAMSRDYNSPMQDSVAAPATQK